MEACSKEEIHQLQAAQNSTQMIQDKMLDVSQMKLAFFIDGRNLQPNLVRPSICLLTLIYFFIDKFRSQNYVNIKHNFHFSGSYRECFSRSYKLGIRARPIKLTPTCELQRTQRDPSSSIRACLCTTSNCNILDTEKAQFRNASSNSNTRVVGKLFRYFAFESVFFCSRSNQLTSSISN